MIPWHFLNKNNVWKLNILLEPMRSNFLFFKKVVIGSSSGWAGAPDTNAHWMPPPYTLFPAAPSAPPLFPSLPPALQVPCCLNPELKSDGTTPMFIPRLLVFQKMKYPRWHCWSTEARMVCWITDTETICYPDGNNETGGLPHTIQKKHI